MNNCDTDISLLSRAVGETEVLELLMRTALDGWPSKQI